MPKAPNLTPSDPQRASRSSQAHPKCSLEAPKVTPNTPIRSHWAQSEPNLNPEAPKIHQKTPKMLPKAFRIHQKSPKRLPTIIPSTHPHPSPLHPHPTPVPSPQCRTAICILLGCLRMCYNASQQNFANIGSPANLTMTARTASKFCSRSWSRTKHIFDLEPIS